MTKSIIGRIYFRVEAQLFHSSSDRAIDQGNEKPLLFSIRTKPMTQRGFHRNKTAIAHFSRSLFGNLVANSDQVFLPIDIFPLQDLVLGVYPDQFTPPNAGQGDRNREWMEIRSECVVEGMVDPPDSLSHVAASSVRRRHGQILIFLCQIR